MSRSSSDEGYEEAYEPKPGTPGTTDEREELPRPPPWRLAATPSPGSRRPGHAAGEAFRYRRPVRPVPPPASQALPYVLLGFMGAVIVGLLGLLIWLLVQRANTPGIGGGGPAAPTADNGALAPAMAPRGGPPRIPMGSFRQLYADLIWCPLVVAVRAAAAYAPEPRAGTVSIPESDRDRRYLAIPPDHRVVVYGARPADQESARVAPTLPDQDGGRYDHLQVLGAAGTAARVPAIRPVLGPRRHPAGCLMAHPGFPA